MKRQAIELVHTPDLGLVPAMQFLGEINDQIGLLALGSMGKEKIFPACSQTKKRLMPGAVVKRSGFLNVRLAKTHRSCRAAAAPESR